MFWKKRFLFPFISKSRSYSEETVVPITTTTSSQHLFHSSASSASLSTSSTQKKSYEIYSSFFQGLKDPVLQEAYQAFNEENQNLSSLLAPGVFIISIAIPLYIIYGSNLRRVNNSSFDLISSIVVFITFTLLLVDVVRVYFQQRAIMRQHDGHLPLASKRFLRHFQQRFFLVLESIMCFRHLVRSFGGECVHNNGLLETWNCNSLADSRMIPAESAIVVIALPILYTVSVHGAHLEFALFLWIMSTCCICASAIITSAVNAESFVIHCSILSLIVIIESRRQNLLHFYTNQKLQEIMKDREKAADEANAQELRHMIANVAHDLKTVSRMVLVSLALSVLWPVSNCSLFCGDGQPLASFLGGIEYISSCLTELKNQSGSCAALNECWASIFLCVTSMRNTNSFMLMTINRCIDYTKASNGVKLVPKYETIDLMETLSLPLNCMKDIQQRISISLHTLSPDICSHIITDKQWLQENMLCLLSNAVKYSNRGTVTLSISKIVAASPPLAATDGSWGNSDSGTRDETCAVATVPARKQDGLSLIVPSHGRVGIEQIEYLHFEVEDHGIGLTEEAMASLFSPFKQAQRLAGGTGLGLFSLAKRIEALDGRCGVEKRRDGAQGSLFWFDIPYRADGEAARLFAKGSGDMMSELEECVEHLRTAVPRPLTLKDCGVRKLRDSFSSHSSRNTSSLAGTFPPSLNILLVDDSPSILKMTSMMLLRQKHEVTTATNGAEAVLKVDELFSRHGKGFDVILMDLQMPVMDGLEATKRLRSFEQSSLGRRSEVVDDDDDGAAVGGASRRSGNDYYAIKDGIEANQADSHCHTSSMMGMDVLPVQHGGIMHQIIVGVSANSDPETANQAFLAGIDAFIAKPFTLDAFYQTINMAMKKEANLRDSYSSTAVVS